MCTDDGGEGVPFWNRVNFFAHTATTPDWQPALLPFGFRFIPGYQEMLDFLKMTGMSVQILADFDREGGLVEVKIVEASADGILARGLSENLEKAVETAVREWMKKAREE